MVRPSADLGSSSVRLPRVVAMLEAQTKGGCLLVSCGGIVRFAMTRNVLKARSLARLSLRAEKGVVEGRGGRSAIVVMDESAVVDAGVK